MAPGATRADTLEMMREMQRATESRGARYEEPSTGATRWPT
jgi:hypothetical protein